jgi:hypothetical protein
MADRNIRGVHGGRDAVDDGGPVIDLYEQNVDSGVVDWVYDGTLKDQGYTEADLRTTVRVLSRRCPYCHAIPGSWCASKVSGVVLAHLDHQHVARRHNRPDEAETGSL